MAIERPKIERPVIERPKITRPTIERPKMAPRGMMWPDFDTLFEPDADDARPFDDLEDTGDIEQNVDDELAVALDVLLTNKKGKNEAYRVANDDEFWLAICFQSEEQKFQFLELSGWIALGDKYIDGLKVAQRLNLAVEPIAMPKPKMTRISRKEG